MTHWNDGANEPSGDEPTADDARHSRVGLLLFAIYLAFYVAFVLTSAFVPAWMAARPWAGVNLAIWYGFGLLGGALVMSLVYSWLCRHREAT